MVAMSATSSLAGTRFSRRTLLAASATGVAVLAAGCTSAPAQVRPPVTDKQAQALVAQVTVQEALVAAYTAAGAADPAVKAAVAELASQANAQLTALRVAAPAKRTASVAPTSPAPQGDARAWLRGQVAATATSHATACLDQSGARAALLGSIAAGLRGQDRRLA
jgi:hypothetical protein